MRGYGSIAGASAYGTTSRTPRTYSRPPPSRASPSNVIDLDAINDDFNWPLFVGIISANSSESTSRSFRTAELQPVGICWELERKRRPVERRQGSTRMGRQFLDIEAEHLDIKAIQGRTGYRRAESRRRLGRPILAFECPENTSFYSNERVRLLLPRRRPQRRR